MIPAKQLAQAGLTAYAPAHAAGAIDLRLDRNEGRALLRPDPETWSSLAGGMNRYPDATRLASQLAVRAGVSTRQVLVTAGGDDALQRIALATLGPGREMLLATPSFEMLPRYALQAGGQVNAVPWPRDAFPLDELRNRLTAQTGLVVVVSPNNPTGQVVPAEALRALAQAASPTTVLVDLAYTEFAEEDLFATALDLPNAVAVRTFSKARGLAGLRVGYAVGPVEQIDRLRCFGNPFPVSTLSLAIAEASLRQGELEVVAHVRTVCDQRKRIVAWLTQHSYPVWPTQANFVLARFPDAAGVWQRLADQGIAVRRFPEPPELEDCLRITMPGTDAEFDRLLQALARSLSLTP